MVIIITDSQKQHIHAHSASQAQDSLDKFHYLTEQN